LTITVLAIGDVVGKPGRRVLARRLAGVIEEHGVDFCVVNAENAAGGSGITIVLARQLLDLGIDVLTTGDHVWQKREIEPFLDSEARILRPANFAPAAAGHGFGVFTSRAGHKVGVVDLIGRVFMKPSDSPFQAIDVAVEQLRAETPIILVDFHAEATAEKIAMGWYLDGRVSAVFGTHTHVQTADARVLPRGTAYITDLGMTGPFESVLGRRVDRVLHHMKTGMYAPFDVARGDVRISGALAEIDPTTGRAGSIRPVQIGEERNEETDPGSGNTS